MTSGSHSRGMKQPLMPAIVMTRKFAYAETCESVRTNVAISRPMPVADKDVQVTIGNNNHGWLPQDIPNNSRPKRNRAALWASEITRNGIVFPSTRSTALIGAILSRRNVPSSLSAMNYRPIIGTRKNANITV